MQSRDTHGEHFPISCTFAARLSTDLDTHLFASPFEWLPSSWPGYGLIFCWLGHDINWRGRAASGFRLIHLTYQSNGCWPSSLFFSLFFSSSFTSFLCPTPACTLASLPPTYRSYSQSVPECVYIIYMSAHCCLNNIYTLNLIYFPTNIIHHSLYTHTHMCVYTDILQPAAPVSFGQQIDLSPKYCQKKIASIFKQIKF